MLLRHHESRGDHDVFEYQAIQKTLVIGGVKIGGTPGKNSTVLIGSLFYSGDKTVLDADRGEFNKKEVESLLQSVGGLSEKTGLPTMIDVVATSTTAIDKYLRFLVDVTEFPLLIDGSGSAQVNIAGLNTAKQMGVMDRVILNSLTPDTDDSLYRAAQETGLRNALLLTFSTAAMASVTKRVELAEQLVGKATDAGMANILIDTGVLDILTLGIACKTLQLLKDKLGLPVGCGAHNAVSTWRGLVPKFGKEAKLPAMVGSSLMPVALGADFVLYGPVKHAPLVYPSVAMVDAALSGILIEKRVRPEMPHPRYLIS